MLWLITICINCGMILCIYIHIYIYTKDIVVKGTTCMLDIYIYIVVVVMIKSVCYVKSR